MPDMSDWAMSSVQQLNNQLGNLAQSMIKDRTSYKYTKKLMGDQWNYQQQAFAMQNARQDELNKKYMDNFASVLKGSLDRAGYSTADPNLQGTSEVGVNPLGTPDHSQFQSGYSYQPFDVISSYGALKQADLMTSQSLLAKEQASKTKNEAEKVKQDFDIAKAKLPEEIELLKASWFEKQKSGELSQKQIDKLSKDIEQITKSIQLMDIDIKWADKFKSKEYSKLGNEIALLMKEKRIKEAEAKLADYGILVGADGLTTICGIVASGKSGDIMPELSKAIAQVVASLPVAVKQFIVSLKDSIEADTSGAWNKLKSWAKSVEDTYNDNKEYDDRVNGEDVAKKRDDEFLTAKDNSEYEDMTRYIYAHADKDQDGNIDNDDWEYWKRKYFRSKRK